VVNRVKHLGLTPSWAAKAPGSAAIRVVLSAGAVWTVGRMALRRETPRKAARLECYDEEYARDERELSRRKLRRSAECCSRRAIPRGHWRSGSYLMDGCDGPNYTPGAALSTATTPHRLRHAAFHGGCRAKQGGSLAAPFRWTRSVGPGPSHAAAVCSRLGCRLSSLWVAAIRRRGDLGGRDDPHARNSVGGHASAHAHGSRHARG
jgi:hypothetical protein